MIYYQNHLIVNIYKSSKIQDNAAIRGQCVCAGNDLCGLCIARHVELYVSVIICIADILQ